MSTDAVSPQPVTADQLHRVLEQVGRSDRQAQVVEALAPSIVDPERAVIVVDRLIPERSERERAIFALTGRKPEPPVPARVPIENPTAGDRFWGVMRGLTTPFRSVLGISVFSALAAGAGKAIGFEVSEVEGLPFFSELTRFAYVNSAFVYAAGAAAVLTLSETAHELSEPMKPNPKKFAPETQREEAV